MKKRFKSHYFLLVAIIFGFGAFIRFYKLESMFPFAGEQGKELIDIKTYLENGAVPLLGPATSHPWLSFGPVYYWMVMPIMFIFNFNPLVLGYLMALFSSLVIIINYLIISKLFSKSTAILSSFLISVSFSFVQIGNAARFFSVVPLLFYPFLYSLIRVVEGERKYLFWWSFWLGMMLNFHLTVLILIPPSLVFIIIRHKKRLRELVLPLFSGFIITQIPFLLYNFKTGFSMIIKLMAWVPYKFMVAVGFIPNKDSFTTTIDNSFISLYKFLLNTFFAPTPYYLLVSLIFIAVLILILVNYDKKYISFNIKILLTVLLLGIIAIIIHGNPPYHYFLPLYPLPILIISYLLSNLWKKVVVKICTLVFLTVFVLVNLTFYFSESWFFRSQEKIEDEFVPFKLQLKAVESIIRDANGNPFSLMRVGTNDQFDDDFAQNYHYLLWWRGNEPIKDQRLTYTIYEGFSPIESSQIFSEGGLVVIRSENGEKK